MRRADLERGEEVLEPHEVSDGGRQRQRVLEHGPGPRVPYLAVALLVVYVLELNLKIIGLNPVLS